MNAETTGPLIAKIQEERNMTQAQLAEPVHVKQKYRSQAQKQFYFTVIRMGCIR